MSNDQQTPYGWQPQQPAPVPARAKKPRRWVGWVGGGIGGLILGLIMGSAGGTTSSSSPEPTTTVTQKAPATQPAPVVKPTRKPVAPETTTPPANTQAPKAAACAGQDDKNAPCAIRVGQAFELGKHTVQAGWKLKRDVLDDAEITGKAKNTGDEVSAMAVELKFLKGDEVVMDVSCSTDQLEPGQSQAISCYSSDDYTTKYDRVTAEAMF